MIQSKFFSNDVVSTSGQLIAAPASSTSESNRKEESRENLQSTASASLSSARNSSIRTSQPIASVSSVSAGGGSSTDWTTQLKNDLGIGSKAVPKPTASLAKPIVQTKLAQTPQQKAAQSGNTHQTSYSVEFVSGEPNDSSALPEYQFGFHVDTNPSNEENSEESFVSSKSRAKNEVCELINCFASTNISCFYSQTYFE